MALLLPQPQTIKYQNLDNPPHSQWLYVITSTLDRHQSVKTCLLHPIPNDFMPLPLPQLQISKY
jgi:hypothetical protein